LFINKRLFINPDANSGNIVPGPVMVAHIPSSQASITQTVPTFTGTDPPVAGVVNTTEFDFMAIAPGETYVGKTASGTGATWAANTYLYKPSGALFSPAVEHFQPQNDGSLMIDVSVPFNQNQNYLPTLPFQSLKSEAYNGRLVIAMPLNSSTRYNIRVYQAFGDDFRLHGYSPYFNSYANGFWKASFGTGVVTLPTVGQQIGQGVFGTHT